MNLTSLWDREGLSVRQASASYIATAKSLGVDKSHLVISPSMVHRMRAKNRELYAKKFEETVFKDHPHLVLHWDGKLLPQAFNTWSVEERIALVFSGVDFEEILGVPVASDGTGQEVAKTVFTEVERLELRDRIIGLSFDTTAANSGMLKGACIHIESLLDRPLLWLACRHHVYEVVLKHVFDECCGRASGPEIFEFKRFQMRWKVMDRRPYCTLLDQEEPLNDFYESQRLLMVDFLRQVLGIGSHPREDYEELLQLCLLFLGGNISD